MFRSFAFFALDCMISISFGFLISLPVFILSLNQSSIDQSNGLSIDPSTFFFNSYLFIALCFFCHSPSFLQFVRIIYSSLLEFVSYFSKASVSSQKIVFPCILSLHLFDSNLFHFDFLLLFSSTGINTKQLVSF